MLARLLFFIATAFTAARFIRPFQVLGVWPAFILICCIELSVHLIYTIYLYPFCLSPLRKISGPKLNSILFGHGKEEAGKSTGIIHAGWGKSIKEPHPNFFRYLGFLGEEKLVPTSANAMRQILTNESFEVPGWIRQGIKILLGDGLVLAEGPRHHHMRKVIAPAFSPAQIRYLTPTFWEKCQEMQLQIRNVVRCSNQQEVEINMMEWIDRTTFDIIGKSAFGADFGALRDPTQGLYKTYNRFYPMDGFSDPVDALCMYVLPLFVPQSILNLLPLKVYEEQMQDRHFMRETFLSLIRKQRQDGKVAEIAEGKHKNLLSVMIQGKKMSEEEMIENMMTVTGAGYATNASTLTWAMYSIATHPEVQTRLRSEIRNVLGSSEIAVTSANMDAMKYLHYVIMECTRLFPAIPGFWRETRKTTVIEGQTIPKGTQLIICPYIVNRSESIWGPDAEEFLPERWEPERYRKGVEYCGAYTTFNLGHKSCIGKEYALRTLKAMMITLIGSFEFAYEGDDPMRNLVPGLTMRPRGGFRLKVRLAEEW